MFHDPHKKQGVSVNQDQSDVNLIGMGPGAEYAGPAPEGQLKCVKTLFASGANDLELRILPIEQREELQEALKGSQSFRMDGKRYKFLSKDQKEINQIGMGPDSDGVGPADDLQMAFALEKLKAGVDDLEFRAVPAEQDRDLENALQDNRSMKIAGVKITRYSAKCVMRDYFGGEGPKHSWLRGH